MLMAHAPPPFRRSYARARTQSRIVLPKLAVPSISKPAIFGSGFCEITNLSAIMSDAKNSPLGPTPAPGPPAATGITKPHHNEQPNHQPRHEPSHQQPPHAQINRPTNQPAQRGREH